MQRLISNSSILASMKPAVSYSRCCIIRNRFCSTNLMEATPLQHGKTSYNEEQK